MISWGDFGIKRNKENYLERNSKKKENNLV